jgi:hypothetical protein
MFIEAGCETQRNTGMLFNKSIVPVYKVPVPGTGSY